MKNAIAAVLSSYALFMPKLKSQNDLKSGDDFEPLSKSGYRNGLENDLVDAVFDEIQMDLDRIETEEFKK